MPAPIPHPPYQAAPVTPVMIDRAGSLDRDDALAVRRLDHDNSWELTVHIADVAVGVPPGGTADQEAARRRESAYGGWRGRAKMLPRYLERRLTLAEDRPCPTMRVRIKFAADGTRLDIQIDRAMMRGAVALEHQAVAAAIANPGHALHGPLCDAAELSEVLLARRRSRGALAWYDLLRGWAINEDGRLVSLRPAESNIAYKIVQECMIAANGSIASWAAEQDLPVLFRNHSAAKVAPPRETLLEDLDLVLTEGSTERIEALRERVFTVMRPAEYAPHMRGHWGLNLPGYVHGTSPLRRYADLVVQRMIFHRLAGLSSPYSHDELALIAESLNDGARADRVAQRAWNEKTAYTRAQRAANTEAGYSGLDDESFHNILKRECKESTTNASLVEETVRRAPRLTALGLQTVLLVSDSEIWEPARTACFQAIVSAPEEAMSVLSVHAQVNGLALPRFAESSLGESPHTVFTSRAEQHFDGHQVLGERCSARTKKAARHLAAVNLLGRLANLTLPPQNQPQSETQSEKSPEAIPYKGRQPVMVLNECAQSRVVENLQFTFAVKGPSHHPVFTCTAHALHRGELLTGQGSASLKATAKTAAAASLMEKIYSEPGSEM